MMSSTQEPVNPQTTSPDRTLGGPPADHHTPAEIVVIGITVLALVVTIGLIFYCRLLVSRREIDERNKRKERTAAGDGQDGGGNLRMTEEGTLVGEEGVELQSLPLVVTAVARFGSNAELATREANEPAGRKQPLWNYIHWKDPYNAPVPRPFARGEPNNWNYMAPNPYGGTDKR